MDKYLKYSKGQNFEEKVIEWVQINLKNYLKNNIENQSEIEHILDYLNSNKAPKRIKFMSYDEAKRGAEKWVKTLNKKAANIIETEEDVEIIKIWKSGFKLVRLKGEAAFKREGKLMRHCVASYYGKDSVKIYSIRDEQNNPHCTMEVDDSGYGNQIKGKGNGAIHPKYIKYVLKSFKHMGLEDLRSSEMDNLGYTVLKEDFSKFLYKHFEQNSIKTLTYKNNTYFYKNSNLVEL